MEGQGGDPISRNEKKKKGKVECGRRLRMGKGIDAIWVVGHERKFR